MLRAGGSAVDACVAAAFASWVAEPALTGPGGGGFLVAYDAARRRPLAIDCFVAVPGEGYSRGPSRTARALRRRLRHRSADLPRRPGVVRRPGRHGRSRVRASPPRPSALGRARRARPLRSRTRASRSRPRTRDVIDLLKGFLGASPEGARVFGPPDAPLRGGDRTSNPPLGDTLERIAAHGARELADGETAHAIVAHQAATGGLPDRGRPGRVPRHPPPPARAALPRARLRDEPAALLRRRADRPRAGRAGRRPAPARSALARDGRARGGRPALRERAADARVRARALPRRGRAARAGGGGERPNGTRGECHLAVSIPLDNPDQRARRRGERRLADLFDRLRLGRRRPWDGRPPQQHARRDGSQRRVAEARRRACG